jgi:hypothetical protein
VSFIADDKEQRHAINDDDEQAEFLESDAMVDDFA